jgi:hypothetical protein
MTDEEIKNNPLLQCQFPDLIMWRQATRKQKDQALAVEMLRAEARDSSTLTGAEWLARESEKLLS